MNPAALNEQSDIFTVVRYLDADLTTFPDLTTPPRRLHCGG